MFCNQALLVFLSVFGAVVATRAGNRGDILDMRTKFPSIQTMMVGNSRVVSTKSVDTHPLNIESSNTGSGLVYLEFYGEKNCGGGVTYSSGYRSGLCLPSSDYVRPPFANDDNFDGSYPFQSLRIGNVTGGCDEWYITYYTDKNCTTTHSVVQTDNYTDCRPAGSLLVSNLVSVRGKCALTSTVPVHSSSYIISDYTGTVGCSDADLVSYTAYSTDTCYGYTSGNSSTLFTANVTSNTVQETQFYSNSHCIRSPDSADQDDLTTAADACNAVKTPGYPVDDDAVAVTEYIGHTLTVMAPSAKPTPKPSAKPTSAPTSNDYVNFAVQQVITGIDIATYNSNTTLYSYTLRESIAACMNDVLPDNIVALVVTGVPSAQAAVSLRGVFATSAASISTAYQVSVYGSALSYELLSQQLSDSVTIGTFTSILRSFARENGATGFITASSNSVTTQNLLATSNGGSKKGLGAGPIAGIVIGAVAFVVLLYFCKRRADKRNAEDPAPEPAGIDVPVVNPLA